MSANRRKQQYLRALARLEPFWSKEPGQFGTVEIVDPTRLTDREKAALSAGLSGPAGTVVFQSQHLAQDGEIHPLTEIGHQLHLHGQPLLKKSLENVDADGTAKIFSRGHDWIAESESDRVLDAHQDGVSIFGVLAVTGLWTESAPKVSATTFTQNLVRSSAYLRDADPDAFNAMFSTDAIVVERLKDGATIRHPMFYVRHGFPAVLYRSPGEHYRVNTGATGAAGARALDFIQSEVTIGAANSVAVQLDTPGKGVLFNNRECVHGRTAFADGPDQIRKLSGAWWVTRSKDVDVSWGGAPRHRGVFRARAGFETATFAK
jgi:hypothetical protein